MWLSFWDRLKLNPMRADYMDFQGLTLDFKEIVHVVIIETLPIFFKIWLFVLCKVIINILKSELFYALLLTPYG